MPKNPRKFLPGWTRKQEAILELACASWKERHGNESFAFNDGGQLSEADLSALAKLFASRAHGPRSSKEPKRKEA